MGRIIVGTAGWSVDRQTELFAKSGSMLERYASVFSGVEVNSSFYRRHRPATWQRWHDAVPADFSFAVKMPKRISHELALVDCSDEVDTFLTDIALLGDKLGPVLLQLPPKLAFDTDGVGGFFAMLRGRHQGAVVIEPRHVSWALPQASEMLGEFGVSRVYADPQAPELRNCATGLHFGYFRLHGLPKIYYSSYPPGELANFSAQLRAAADGAWCIFDNTASGAALDNATELLALLY